MKFLDIRESDKVHPGEYVLHLPTNQIVLCGSFNRERKTMKVMLRGKLHEDKIENFQKIQLSHREKRAASYSRCKGCSG
tara:strand:- start:948 stop:1184 length:237 start_codon:yes stop_codon:yes gene_type:complete